MSKIFLTVLFFGFLLALIPGVVYAETSTSSSKLSNIKSKVQEQLQEMKEIKNDIKLDKKQVKTETKEQTKERVRQSLTARYNNHQKAVLKTEALLDKLQLRIDKAKAAGKDTTNMSILMSDAKNKLADAKTRLANIAAKKDIAQDKAGYMLIANELLAINQDLRIAGHDAAQIISLLKGFNRAPEATKSSSVKYSTTSANK